MRIISGSLRGQNIITPNGHKTHPMSEKMRGALFNVLGDIVGFDVFDAYGGTGAVAFEALSRGANSALITEIDNHSWAIIKQNAENLKVTEKVKIVRANAASWCDSNYYIKFDLVICDPPYQNINIEQLTKISINLKQCGIFVLSSPGNYVKPEFKDLKLIKFNDYGDGSLAFYRKTYNE